MITGEEDWKRAAELPFIRKKLVVPYSRDVIRASAEAAAKEMQDQVARMNYLKVRKGTAFILLNMDCDGWAGRSFACAFAHPIVEKTLLQFKKIKRVVWQEAPGERCLSEKGYIQDDHARIARACVDLVRSATNDNIYYRGLPFAVRSAFGSAPMYSTIFRSPRVALLRALPAWYIRASTGRVRWISTATVIG